MSPEMNESANFLKCKKNLEEIGAITKKLQHFEISVSESDSDTGSWGGMVLIFKSTLKRAAGENFRKSMLLCYKNQCFEAKFYDLKDLVISRLHDLLISRHIT